MRFGEKKIAKIITGGFIKNYIGQCRLNQRIPTGCAPGYWRPAPDSWTREPDRTAASASFSRRVGADKNADGFIFWEHARSVFQLTTIGEFGIRDTAI